MSNKAAGIAAAAGVGLVGLVMWKTLRPPSNPEPVPSKGKEKEQEKEEKEEKQQQQESLASVNKNLSAKNITLIRHAESEWNEWMVTNKRWDKGCETFLDCGITAEGEAQCKRLRLDLQARTAPDLAVVSPLRRSLLTVQNSLLVVYPETPVVVLPEIAEILSDACDIGTSPQELKKDFPDFDWSNCKENWWWMGKSPEETWIEIEKSEKIGEEMQPEVREPDPVVIQRIQKFKRWLAARPEMNVLVFGHSEWFHKLTTYRFGEETFGTKTENCEIVEWNPIHRADDDGWTWVDSPQTPTSRQ